MQKEFVSISKRLTWEEFGCKSVAFFDKYIRGKRLPVVFVYGRFTVVEIAGEQYSIHEEDLVSKKAYQEKEAA